MKPTMRTRKEPVHRTVLVFLLLAGSVPCFLANPSVAQIPENVREPRDPAKGHRPRPAPGVHARVLDRPRGALCPLPRRSRRCSALGARLRLGRKGGEEDGSEDDVDGAADQRSAPRPSRDRLTGSRSRLFDMPPGAREAALPAGRAHERCGRGRDRGCGGEVRRAAGALPRAPGLRLRGVHLARRRGASVRCRRARPGTKHLGAQRGAFPGIFHDPVLLCPSRARGREARRRGGPSAPFPGARRTEPCRPAPARRAADGGRKTSQRKNTEAGEPARAADRERPAAPCIRFCPGAFRPSGWCSRRPATPRLRSPLRSGRGRSLGRCRRSP